MSRAEHLLARIEEQGASIIDELIDDRESESWWLDFKNVDRGWTPKLLGSNNSKNFSKALSGFGNGDGGLILWGVDCRPDKERGDLPWGKQPISNPFAFRALLEDAVSKAATPHHTGGVRSSVLHGTGKDHGYVCTYVPRGPDQPYRAMHDHKYYYRIGSSFEVISHDILAGMFGRLPKPSLFFQVSDLELDVKMPGYGRYWFRATFSLDVANAGPGFAQIPHVLSRMIEPSQTFGIFSGDKSWDSRETSNRSHSHVWAQNIPLPPHRRIPFLLCDLIGHHDQEQSLGFELSLGAEGTPINQHWFGFCAEDYRNAVQEFTTHLRGTSVVSPEPIHKLVVQSFGQPDSVKFLDLSEEDFLNGSFLRFRPWER